MALMVQERSAFEGLIEEIEASKFDGALLMSLLEESHCEELINDDQLNTVIRSLEEEINVNKMANLDFVISEPQFIGEVERDCGNSEFSFDYLDELNEMEMVPSSPSDDMNWYMEHPIEEMDEMMEFIDHEIYAQNCYADIVPLEEHGYTTLLHESFGSTVM